MGRKGRKYKTQAKLRQWVFGDKSSLIPPDWVVVDLCKDGYAKDTQKYMSMGQTQIFVDTAKGKGMESFILGHRQVKRSEEWKAKVFNTAREVKHIMKNKIRPAHRHDPRGYYGEVGYQVRTHGVPLLLKTKPGVTTAERQAAYNLFDKLGSEAEEPWAPLFKAFRIDAGSRVEHQGGVWGKKPSMGKTRAGNGMLTINFALQSHLDRDGIALTCCASKEGARHATFFVEKYGLSILLNKGNHQWCFFGSLVKHGSTYDFAEGDDGCRALNINDQISWGSWAYVPKGIQTRSKILVYRYQRSFSLLAL